MTQHYTKTLTDAMHAYENGQIFDWVQEYLRGEGWQHGLAEDLMAGKPGISVLQEFPLKKLKRIIGPEQDINYHEPLNAWEKRVSALILKIKEGVQFPPLIVTDLWKDLEIADGSHRQEALLRCGYEKYWTIFLFKKLESKNLLYE